MNAYINEHEHSFFRFFSCVCAHIQYTFCTTMTMGCKYFISATKKKQRTPRERGREMTCTRKRVKTKRYYTHKNYTPILYVCHIGILCVRECVCVLFLYSKARVYYFGDSFSLFDAIVYISKRPT